MSCKNVLKLFTLESPNFKYKLLSTMTINTKRKKYPSDISKNGWVTLKAHLPYSKSTSYRGGRPSVELKEVINAIFYVLKTGVAFPMIFLTGTQYTVISTVGVKMAPGNLFTIGW